MTEENRTENLGADREFTEDELNGISGGDAKTKTPTPPKTPTTIEIKDFSFGIENPSTSR